MNLVVAFHWLAKVRNKMRKPAKNWLHWLRVYNSRCMFSKYSRIKAALKKQRLEIMNRAILILLMTFALSSLQAFCHEQIVIQLAKPNHTDAVKNQYIHDILDKSFAAMDADVVLLYNVKPMNDKRIIEQLSHNKTITLAWLSLPHKQLDSLVMNDNPTL